MDLYVERVQLPDDIASPNLDVTKLGFGTPSGAIVLVGGANNVSNPSQSGIVSMGYWDGTNKRCSTIYAKDAATTTESRRRRFTDRIAHVFNSASTSCAYDISNITDGVRITMTVDSTVAGRYATVILFGPNIECNVGTFTPNGTQDAAASLTGLSYEPDLVFLDTIGVTDGAESDHAIFSYGVAVNDGSETQRFVAGQSANDESTSDASCYFASNRVVGQLHTSLSWTGELTSFNSDGFTVTTRDGATGGDLCHYMTVNMNGGEAHLETLDTPTSTGTHASTQPGFKPDILITGSTRATLINTRTDHCSVGLGAAMPGQEGAFGWHGEDNEATSKEDSRAQVDALMWPTTNGAEKVSAGLQSMDANGWTLDFTAVHTSTTLSFVLSLRSKKHVTCSIGTRSAENVNITAVSGSGPYEVTLSGATSSTNNGDKLTDEHATPRDYLILAGAGTDTLLVADLLGAGSAPDASGTSQATTVRCYSTIQGWADEHGDTSLYQDGDDGIGELYNEGSPYDETVNIDGSYAIRSLNAVKLTAPAGERHDGTLRTGARIRRQYDGQAPLYLNYSGVDVTVEWIEVDGNSRESQNGLVRMGGSSSNKNVLRNCLVYDNWGGSAHTYGILIQGSADFEILNCVLHQFYSFDGSKEALGIKDNAGVGVTGKIINTSVYNVVYQKSSSQDCIGIKLSDQSNRSCINCIAMGVTNNGSGTEADFDPSSPSNATMHHNLSEDSSASGTGSKTGKSPSNQFVSIATDSEDLHLKNVYADAFGAGQDQGQSPEDVNVDIDGFDRHADDTYDPWDMGAHELQEEAALGNALIVTGL